MKRKFLPLIAILITVSLLIISCDALPFNISMDSPAQEEIANEGLDEDSAPAESTIEEIADPSGSLVPAGAFVNTQDGMGLSYVNAAGQLITELKTPGIASADSKEVHVAGTIPSGPIYTPLVYRSWDPQQAIMINVNDTITTLRKSDGFFAMSGAPGQSAIAFSEVQMDGDEPHSYLYAGNTDNLGDVSAFFDLIDAPTYMALMPVGVEALANQPQSVWYTKSAWGIGGVDLIFPITRGLYRFDLTSGDNIQYLDPEKSFQGISPDFSTAGWVDFEPSGDRALQVMKLAAGQVTSFQLDPSSDRGAGFVVFSPDNQYAAWLEASGSMVSEPLNFQARVRAGYIPNGGIVNEVNLDTASQFMPSGSAAMMKPVGWLDNMTVLIECHGQDWNETNLLTLDIASGQMALFAAGSFSGFTYQ